MESLKSKGTESRKHSVGGVTTYLRGGQVCKCASRRPKLTAEKRRAAKESESDEQRASREIFRFMSSFTVSMFKVLSPWNPWNAFARDLTLTGRNLFFKRNCTSCGPAGVTCFPTFMFSDGWLALPEFTLVERVGWSVRLEWDMSDSPYAGNANDQLLMGYFHGAYPDSPQVVWDAGVTRSAGRADFSLPDHGLDVSDPLHVYPFFGTWNGEDYSRSMYYRLEDGTRFVV